MKNSYTKNNYKLLSALVIFTLIIFACGTSKNKDNTSSNNDSKGVTASLSVSASQLCTDYNANEVSADNKYKDKILEISGTVEEIRKDFVDNIIIELKGCEFLSNIDCYFSKDDNSTAQLSKGQKITIVGKCTGFLMKSVQIKNSKLK